MSRATPEDLTVLVLDHLAGLVGVPASSLSPDLDVTELGLSSAQVLELVWEVEAELDIVITESDLLAVTTVAELVGLAQRLGAAGP